MPTERIIRSPLRLDDCNVMFCQPIAGSSWKGMVVENLLGRVPDQVKVSFDRITDDTQVKGGGHGNV